MIRELFNPSSLGLVDEGESPEDAAIRELEEETGVCSIEVRCCSPRSMYAGYKADEVLHSSPIMVSDPGAVACSFGSPKHNMFPHSGMTNANMKLVLVGVSFPGQLEAPKQKLEPGESIVRRVVELSKLADEMKGS